MRYGSLFSGIGGFDLGLDRAGMRGAWQVEIDKHCNTILEKHWPGVKRFDDVCRVGERELGRVDLICGGFPCQDLSVAGKRSGLAGERSGLFFEFMRIVGELTPRWVLIENVPGLLSSNGGRDMGTVIGALGELGYGWAYRVLDAQYFGVAQRRRRVFIVGCLGDGGSAAQVLFESQSVCGDPPPSREAGKELARDVAASLRSRGEGTGTRIDAETGLTVTAALSACGAGTCGADDNQAQANHLVAHETGQGWWNESDKAGTLRAEGENRPSRPSHIVATFEQNSMAGRGTLGYDEDAKVAKPVKPQSDHQMVCIKGAAIGRKPEAGPQRGEILEDGSCYTLNATEVHAVAQNQRGELRTSNVHPQLTCGGGKPGEGYPCVAFEPGNLRRRCGAEPNEHVVSTLGAEKQGDTFPHVASGMVVRRLTPTECERLQGFPDGWTEGCSDSARYRMLGNAVAVPVAEWIGRRIAEV